MRQYQQGDVLARQVERVPDGCVRQQHRVLAHGESGHSHVAEAGTIWTAPDGRMYLDLEAPTVIQHEEHKPQLWAAGTYEIARVREMDWLAAQERRVYD